MEKSGKRLLKTLGVAATVAVPGLMFGNTVTPVLSLLLLGPTLVFSNCKIIRAEEISEKTVVDFNFLVASNDSSINVDHLETLELDFIFQPGNVIESRTVYTEIDAQGEGVYRTAHMFNYPIDISGKSSIRVTIKTQQGIDENDVQPCTTPVHSID